MSKSVGKMPFAAWKIFLLCIMAGTALLALPVSAADKPVVTVVTQGSGAYYLGEKVVLSGMNTDTGSTYLYITGPNLPESGGKLTSPDKKAVSENAETFTVVSTKADKTWEYPWYTAGLRLDAGSYTLYAVSTPKTADQLTDAPYGTTSIIIKKPYISQNISSSTVVKGQPFTVTGIAEGIPPEVQIWIFGNNYVFTTKTPVNSNASFTFTADAALSGQLPAGENYLIVQHPMADNQFDFVVSGDYIRDTKQNSGTDIFKITGPGSLQGSDAVDALITAISDREVHDTTYAHDTYTLIPFQVTDTGSLTSPTTGGTSVPVQQSSLLYIPVGGLLLVLGIVLWKQI
ncbi:MAG: immunoglobulin domain-containing protein [Methanoregula sp.]